MAPPPTNAPASLTDLDLPRARSILADPDATFGQLVLATLCVTRSPDSTIPDLVACLRHGGLIAELVAGELFARTGRHWPKKYDDIINPDQWEQYLLRRRLTGEGWAPPPVPPLRRVRRALLATWRALLP